HTRSKRDWSSDVCSSDLNTANERLGSPRKKRQRTAALQDLAERSGWGGAPASWSAAVLCRFPSWTTLPARTTSSTQFAGLNLQRSEERRVGKECRERRSP